MYLTNDVGDTPEFGITPDVPITIFLKQKNTAYGLCVGQVYAHTFASTDLETYNLHTVFQPVLESIVLDSTIEHHRQGGCHGR